MNDLSNDSTFTLEDFPLASSSPKKKEEFDEDLLLPPPEHKATFFTSQKKSLPPLPPRPYSPSKKKPNMTLAPAKVSPQKSPAGSKDSLQILETETSSNKVQGSSSPGNTNIDESITTETCLNDSLDQIELSRREIDQVANELSNAAHSPPISLLDSIKKYLKIPCSSRKAPFTLRGGAEKALIVSIDSVLHPDLLDKLHPGDILFSINNE